LLQSFGGDCSAYPLTLAQLKTWPSPMDQNHYEAAVEIEVYEEVPHAPSGSVKWKPGKTKTQWDNACQSAGCIRVKMSDTNQNLWPAAITADELACLRSTTTPPVIIRVLGCLAPETRVKLESGEYRRADEIKRGEKLWNPLLRTGVAVKGITRGPENIPIVEISIAGRTVRVTESHPMLLANPAKEDRISVQTVSLDARPKDDGIEPGTVQAKTLKVGDLLRMEDGSSGRIEKIERALLPGKRLVYNFSLEGDSLASHYFVAEGVVTGDLILQNRLARKHTNGT
jgi:hypothetical protein